MAIVAQSDSGEVIVWSLIIVVIVLLAVVAIGLVRRWTTKVEPEEPSGFTLGDIRQIHKSGKMSDEEFEHVKMKIVAAARKEDESAGHGE